MDSFTRRHQKWIGLRTEFRLRKREKDWDAVITTCDRILKYASKNTDLQIVAWLFIKEKANAFDKKGLFKAAIACYETAIAACKMYRKTAHLREPSDFLKDVERMSKKVERIRKKL